MQESRADETYLELASQNKEYIATFDNIYQLKSNEIDEINKIYQDIKSILIDRYHFDPETILKHIDNAFTFHLFNYKPYWALIKKIDDEYKPFTDRLSPFCQYLFNKAYGLLISDYNKNRIRVFEKFYGDLDFSKSNPLFRSILYDDISEFSRLTEIPGFYANEMIECPFLHEVNGKISLIELCCYFGSVNCFKILRSKFNSFITPNCLNYSFLNANPDIVKECLAFQKPNGDSLSFSIISHNIDIFIYILNECNFKIPYQKCVEYQNLQSFLIGIDRDKYNNNDFLYFSCGFNIPSLCNFFISRGNDVNKKTYNGESSIYCAVKNNNCDVVKTLIDHDSKVNVDSLLDNSPLHYAVQFSSIKIVELLLSKGADPNAKNRFTETPIFWSAKRNDIESIKLLLKYGADINWRDVCGSNVLFQMQYLNKETLEFLINNAADVNCTKIDKGTLLHEAAMFNLRDIAETLCSHGLKINSRDKYGATPLHIASINNSLETAKLLLENGADINEKTNNSNTALILATINDHPEIAELLLNHGADINDKDGYGYSVVSICVNRKKCKMLEFLKSHGFI